MELKCEYQLHNWKTGNQTFSKYTCEVKEAKIIEPTTITAFIGAHIQNPAYANQSHYYNGLFTDVYVTGIKFSGLVEHFPEGIIVKFPSITSLSIVGCGLKRINKEDLGGFGQLQTLDLDDNKLTELDEDLLINTPKLQRISIANNQIKKFPSKLFEPVIKTLAFVDFRNNAGLDFHFDKHETNESLLMNAVKLYSRIRSKDHELLEVIQKLESQTKMLEGILTSGKFSDFTIKVHGKERKVHKCILAAQSSVFDELFKKDTIGEVPTQVPDFGEEIFEEFLKCFYLRDIQNEDHLMELFQLAVAFNVPDLKKACEKLILKSLEESKALGVYNLGAKHSSEVLKRAGFESLKSVHPEVGEFLYDMPEVVNVIIEAKLSYVQKKKSSSNLGPGKPSSST